MNDENVSDIHWSFWVLAVVALIWYSKHAESKSWIR